MNKLLIAIALSCSILVAAATDAAGQNSLLTDNAKSQFKVGQIRSYKTRPNEKKSSFIVLKVENHPKLGNVIHIAFRDLRVKKPNGDFIETAGHLPFAEKSIDQCVVKLLKEKADLPDYEEGYNLWREAFDAGKAGVYTVTVAEAIDVMETTLNQ